ncbi:peptidase S1 [[Phormidium ambiguum] IAM M-71]|uniref:Peptidase S1 n=1 Tax=[Phormidium ambiguum] IAM M-71 TaxID=454136 RepID=A0A1U7I7A6_9CYAN|nr:peptidase S1 [Phormidium ambiguum IAM M-71]
MLTDLEKPENPKLSQNITVNNVSVAEVAKQVTVRIFSNSSAGSGVIISRQGQVYTVLTCDHVLNEKDSNSYTILTSDGRTYPAKKLAYSQFGDKDLAIIQFVSPQIYQVAEMGNSDNLGMGEVVYAAGFPNWYLINPKAIESTRDWGMRAFRLTRGNVEMISDRSLPRGYQLGYTNEIENGMSGGPVLDKNGRLIGINGRLKFPPQGIAVYRFADGTMPSAAAFQRMESLSWAIPISTFRRLFK